MQFENFPAVLPQHIQASRPVSAAYEGVLSWRLVTAQVYRRREARGI